MVSNIWVIMENRVGGTQATLSSHGDMTSFCYGHYNIRFRTPSCLKCYTDIKDWDHGYLVVMADYDGIGLVEEYIDLIPILQNLYLNVDEFLKPIHSVKIDYHEQ